ncbi:MAG: hypothetical protein JXA87_15860 [Thermoleophilia bacterium]|nr:hypothetical protein [Thermoleophilia bacterium]
MKIAEVLRHAWSRLIRKQWLFLYPLALAVIDILAFFAVYAATGGHLSWTDFFTADFDRWGYVDDQFFTGFAFTTQLAVATVAGLVACGLAAMIRAPFFRAIAGSRYPVAPRGWKEAGSLFAVYLFTALIFRLLPLPVPDEGSLAQLALVVHLVIGILIVFADYLVVYEGLGFFSALRRSMQLCAHRWVTVVLVFAGIQLVWYGFDSLYRVFYEQSTRIFILLPVSRVLVESFIVLFVDLILIFLYEEIRRQSPAA